MTTPVLQKRNPEQIAILTADFWHRNHSVVLAAGEYVVPNVVAAAPGAAPDEGVGCLGPIYDNAGTYRIYFYTSGGWQYVQAGPGGAAVHSILSATHGDSVAAAVVRGDLIYGNATPAWQRLAHPAAANRILQSSAADVQWSAQTLTLTTALTNQGAAGVLNWGGAFTLTIPATGTVTLGTGAANQVAYWTGANTVAGDAGLTYNAATDSLTAAGVVQCGGAANTEQLIVQANAGQTNANPLVLLQDSGAAVLGAFHADHATNVFVGYDAGRNNNAVGGGQYNLFLGRQAGYKNTTAAGNTFIGYSTFYENTTGRRNFGLGFQCGYYNQTGNDNVFIGQNAAIGTAIYTSSDNNIAIGRNAMAAISSNCDDNVGIGYGVLVAITSGDGNIACGFQAGDNVTTGNYNIAIGYNIDVPAAAGNQQLTIGNLIFGTTIDGTGTTVSSGYIGVGVAAPATRFEVEETITLTGNLADGYASCVTLDPGYTGAFTVTRHNYVDVNNVSTAGGAAVTDGAMFRFDAAIGAHCVLGASFNTTDSNGDTTTWAGGLIININGTLYQLPIIAYP